MALRYDLHIHSCLSPCADDDMTPYNICAMAALKGLQAIAVADHQSAGNLWAAARCAEEQGLLLVPALELISREEVHLLAYFPSLPSAEAMGAYCARHLPDIKNRPDIFGRQRYMDDRDGLVGEEERLLILAMDVGLSELAREVRRLGGVPVPAHINRGSHGILGALGFIPPGEAFTALEVCPGDPLPEDLGACRLITGSDAHTLGDIREPGPLLHTGASAREICLWLSGG